MRLVTAVFAISLQLATPAAAQVVEPVAIRGVAVIDLATGELLADHNVIVLGDQILSVAVDAPIPPGAQIIEGKGRFLIPGLWDMHVHATGSPGFPELYIANGVTGVRDMFSPISQINSVRSRVESGKRPGPRIVAAGRIVDGKKPIWAGSVEAVDAEQGRKAVATLAEEGSDFIKVYSKLSRDAYFAIADAAKARGIPFAGHVPRTVRAAEASDAGQRSFEHMNGILEGCSTKEDVLISEVLPTNERLSMLLETFDAERAEALGAKLAANGTWMCPTLTVLRAISHLDDQEFVADERVRYIAPFWGGFWDPKRDARFQGYTPELWALQKRFYEKSKTLVGHMHLAGVKILAGTDVANPYCFPGFSLHDELELLVEAGLSELDALRAATCNPAAFLGESAAFGAIRAGMTASLVLLDANPLDDIANTKKIVAVLKSGVFYDRAALDQILSKADRRK